MNRSDIQTKNLTLAAILMAMNVIMSTSLLSVPVPGGHMYFNDVIIVTAAVVLDPLYAFIVGGIGAFLGDMLFYPLPMFVSLFSHGLQALIISLTVHRIMKSRPVEGSIVGSLIGLIVSVVGYTLGRAFIYSTPEYAMLKLPFQIMQTAIGSSLALMLCWKANVVKYGRIFLGNQG